MQYFNTSLNSQELRLIYRRLAMLNHPDKGGNPEIMKKINTEYNYLRRHIKVAENAFKDIVVGDRIIINKSNSIVTHVSKNTFTAKSEYTKRYAVFSKSTGICINNPKFKASVPKKIEYAS